MGFGKCISCLKEGVGGASIDDRHVICVACSKPVPTITAPVSAIEAALREAFRGGAAREEHEMRGIVGIDSPPDEDNYITAALARLGGEKRG